MNSLLDSLSRVGSNLVEFMDIVKSTVICGISRVHRLMQRASLRAQVGYRKPRARGGAQHVVTPNRLERQFNPSAPNMAWVTDITYIKTHEGWLYFCAVMDLFSRPIIGWSCGKII